FTVGATATVEHAEVVSDVPLGVSEGVPGQRFTLSRPPLLLDGEPPVVQVSTAEGWETWTAVEHFGGSAPDDRHVLIDATSG
ncbi:putative baseplate assembly protein, partial [Streptomyces sp. URMC 126]